MDDLSSALESFLARPDAMAQMEAMAKQLGLSPGDAGPEPQEQKDARDPGGQGLSLSPQLLAGALQATGGVAASAKLFETLRPLFGAGKEEKLNRAARAVQLMYTAKAVVGALETGGPDGK